MKNEPNQSQFSATKSQSLMPPGRGDGTESHVRRAKAQPGRPGVYRRFENNRRYGGENVRNIDDAGCRGDQISVADAGH